MTGERYRASYARLLYEHMRLGHSRDSFAGLEQGGKKAVSRTTVRRWLQRHDAFARACDKGEAAALLFFERRLLAGMREGGNRADTRAAMFVLGKRFADVYGDKAPQSPCEQETPPSSSGMDIRDIDDPERLTCMANSWERRIEDRKRRAGCKDERSIK